MRGAGGNDAPIGERHLLADLLVGPTGSFEGGRDVDAADVGFVHDGIDCIPEFRFSQDYPTLNAGLMSSNKPVWGRQTG
jgi:hypothetical protein